MQFKFRLATKVLFGRDCVRQNRDEFAAFGKKAVIVTGKNSGRSSGALDDVTQVLNELSIEYIIYDRIENNPSLKNVADGGKEAAIFGADFVIGIGGGSPLDAAKAIAVLAVNDINPVDLYKNSFTKTPLPILAVPTTAGTGSEVTPYSILTRRDMQTKMSFGNEDTFPKIAFMDAKYTESLPYDVTVNTAVDALSHAVEGYLSKRSTYMSDLFAIEAISRFGNQIENLVNRTIDVQAREKLLYMAMLGGMVIAHTGTTIVHGLGYNLTYFKNVPHGKANGVLMREYLDYNKEWAEEKVTYVLKLLKLSDTESLGKLMDRILGERVSVSEEEMVLYATLTMKQRSTSFNIRNVMENDLIEIMKKALVLQ